MKPKDILLAWCAVTAIVANIIPKENVIFFALPAIILTLLLSIWVGKENRKAQKSNQALITFGILSFAIFSTVVIFTMTMLKY